jgi:hypothetical protein
VKLRESEVQGGYFKSGGSSGGSCEVSPNSNINVLPALHIILTLKVGTLSFPIDGPMKITCGWR